MSRRLFGTLMIGVLSVCGAARCVPSAAAAEEMQSGVQLSLDNGVTDPVQVLPSELGPQLAMADDVALELDASDEPARSVEDAGLADDSTFVAPEDMNVDNGDNAMLDDGDATVPADNSAEAAPASEVTSDEKPATLTLEQLGGALEAAFVAPVMVLVNEVSDIVTAILNPETMTADDSAEVSTTDESATETDMEPSTTEEAPAASEMDDSGISDETNPEVQVTTEQVNEEAATEETADVDSWFSPDNYPGEGDEAATEEITAVDADQTAIDESEAAVSADNADEAAPAPEATSDDVSPELTSEQAGELFQSEFVDPLLRLLDEVRDIVTAILHPQTMEQTSSL